MPLPKIPLIIHRRAQGMNNADTADRWVPPKDGMTMDSFWDNPLGEDQMKLTRGCALSEGSQSLGPHECW